MLAPPKLTAQDAHIILQLRLVIARAAGADSLRWWDDDSFTEPARFVLERTFPVAPPLAARSLSLRAAHERHAAAAPAERNILHLFHLDADGQDRLAVRSIALLDVPVPDHPIASISDLRQALRALRTEPFGYRILRRSGMGALQIEVGLPAGGMSPIVHRALALAWAYLEGQPGAPVIPYCVE